MGTKRRATEVVQAARGRLKGALQDVINVTEDEEEADPTLPTRGRPPKRVKKEATPPPPVVLHTFIMKLFDRSVDLAKYNENTPLYPICRAWILNRPRSNKLINFTNRELPEPIERKLRLNLLEDIESGKALEITEMPVHTDVETSRVPSLLPFQKKISKDNVDLNYDLDNPSMTRQEILQDMKSKWTQVRKKWHTQSKEYEEKRYGHSMKILEALYKR